MRLTLVYPVGFLASGAAYSIQSSISRQSGLILVGMIVDLEDMGLFNFAERQYCLLSFHGVPRQGWPPSLN